MLRFFRMVLEVVAEKSSDTDKEDFLITENQIHTLEIERWICCQGKVITHEKASQLANVWKDKDIVGILDQHWSKKYNNDEGSKGYKASEIAQNLGVSLGELKKWIQRLELREYIILQTKKLVFTVYIVRFYRNIKELVYILLFLARKETFSYARKGEAGEIPKKLVVLASGCSGKTTFSKRKSFCGYTLSDSLIKKWRDRTKESLEEFQESFWRTHPGKICVLDNLFQFRFIKGVYAVVVMPSKKNHLRNYRVRRKKTGTFSMMWILKWRKDILQFTREKKLKIFPDFETALIAISKEKEL